MGLIIKDRFLKLALEIAALNNLTHIDTISGKKNNKKKTPKNRVFMYTEPKL